MKRIIAFTLVCSCAILNLCCCSDDGVQVRAKNALTQKFLMDCTDNLGTDYSLHRCENSEAICYIGDSKLNCKFKSTQ